MSLDTIQLSSKELKEFQLISGNLNLDSNTEKLSLCLFSQYREVRGKAKVCGFWL